MGKAMSLSKRGDVVYTPAWVAQDMCKHFQPTGRVLDPCRGHGVFERYLWGDTEWCEITDGRDFFGWSQPVDWVVGNPPYSMTRPWFQHSFAVAENLLYLVPLRNVFSGYGFLREISGYGGIKEIRIYGTGSRLGFPMGNAVGAMHIPRGWGGPMQMTFYDDGLTGLAEPNPSKRSGGTPRYSRPEPGGPDAGRIAASRPAGPAAAPPATRPPARTTRLGPGRGRAGRNGHCPVPQVDPRVAAGDSVRPGPENQ
jgi:hypothetical protein